ncbi:Disease resistance protein [Citrus sinensis]|uniref:Disease resistance protein n=2 Tax=Citrus sinensis TaxID=2711 RepID=A0ACB8KEV0_CITSI|nr:Disease resistance protein [Citrus sinensis]
MYLSLDEFVPIEAIKERKRKRAASKGRKVGGVERLSQQIDRLVDTVEMEVEFKKKIMVLMFLKQAMAEVGLAAFSSIVSEGAKSLFKPIIRQISYVFKYQSYIDDLKDQVKQLGYKRETVQQPVNHARLQGDELYEGVTDWLHSVDEFISEGVAKSIIDDEERAKKFCFKGLCPNLMSRYKLSKQAAKAAEAAAGLVGKGNFSNVSYRPTPKSTGLNDGKDNEAFDSRMKVFQDVMEALKDDKLNIIGVYGMGGVGKTTLVKQVAKKVMEDKLIDKVVMAEVTQNPDPQKIQDKLASDLGMKFDLNDSIHHRASRLRERLKQEKRVLIILDNIWTKLELDAVGIPSGDVDEKDREDDQRRCTIILTSRSRDLLCNDMNCQKIFWIDALSKEEALQLFEKIVGDSTKISAFQSMANEIVERCGGLPVALSTVANALKTKELDFWKDALNQLRRSDAREIHGMQANVYTSIILSYDFLESAEAKSLFRLCGLYSEGDAIEVSDLLRYGVGWGLFENVYTLEEARSRVHRLIDNLKSSCLLLDGDAEDEVKMHDVIHVVAVSIAAEKRMFNIPNVADVEKKMEETKQKGPIAISLPHRDIQELPERLQCPNLQLFLLFGKGYGPMQISDLFFEGTEELKVLSLTRIPFSSLPSSLGRLINLQTFCLDGCGLKDIAIVGQLKKLEILSLRDSDVKELPLVIGQLTRLQLLDLSNCSSLVVIAPNVISKLSRLEELYMSNSFSQWEKVEGGSNASLVELKGLSKLTTLEIHVRDAEILPQDLVSVELQSYRICIGNTWWSSRSVKSGLSRLMKLQGLEKFGILLQNYRMKLLLKRTEYLYLEELKGELDDGEGFPRLKHLSVKSCSEILHIVRSVGRVRRKVFPLLESLSLRRLINLETICDSQLTEDQSFSNLRIIEVYSCYKLKHLFSFSIAKNLLRLQKVEVEFCHDLEMIFGPDREKPTSSLGFNEIIADDDPAPKVIVWSCDCLKYLFSYSMVNSLAKLQHLEISYCESMEGVVDTTGWSERDEGKLIELKVFPKLHSLKLEWLPELTSFANTGQIHSDLVVEFPSLLNLEIHGCNNMLRFISTSSPADTLHSEMQSPPLFDEKVLLPRLEVLDIAWMANLRTIWHHQLALESFRKLKNLEISSLVNLKVSGCPKLEEIVGHVGQEVKENRIAFSKLKVLILDDLPRLTSFCLENYTLEFPSLEQVFVTLCPDMMTFSLGILSTPKLYKVQIGFRDIKDLQLSHFPRLQEIWHGQALPVSFFNNLRELVVDDCTNMSSAIPANLLRCLNNLRYLEVRNCDSLEEVLHLEELNAKEEHIGPLFPRLSWLRLIDLPKLKRFYNFTGNIIELPELRYLTIENCPDMETFISNSTSVLHMTADNKEAQKLKSEENILVANQIQHLFNEKVAFPKLRELKLSKLHKVQHLWKENDESNKAFANLGSLEISECIVRQCPKMKIFSQGVLDTPMLNKVNVTEEEKDDDEGCGEGNLNDTIKKLFNEMVSINEVLALSSKLFL